MPTETKTTKHKNKQQAEDGFYVAGLLAGHVLLYNKTLAVNFNACFLKLVLQRPMTLADLQVC
jgi:hypothetical protein